MKLAIVIALAVGTLSWPAHADVELVTSASGQVTLAGGAQGTGFWQHASGIISFGPSAKADSDGLLDASTGSGCFTVGTSFDNTERICAPFQPGEVVLALNTLEHGAGILTINTLARQTGRVFAVMPMVDEGPGVPSPLAPLFWVPWTEQNISEQEVTASVRSYQTARFDVQPTVISVNDEQAVLSDGYGLLVTDAKVAQAVTP